MNITQKTQTFLLFQKGTGLTAASGQIAFDAGDVPEAGDTVTIVSADATSKTYTFVAAADEDASAGKVHASNTATTTVDSLNNAIVHANGHGTKFTVTQVDAGLTLNLVNTTLGTTGHTTMTKTGATDAQIDFTQFASGADAVPDDTACYPSDNLISMTCVTDTTLLLHFKSSVGDADADTITLTTTSKAEREVMESIAQQIANGSGGVITVADDANGIYLHDDISACNITIDT